RLLAAGRHRGRRHGRAGAAPGEDRADGAARRAGAVGREPEEPSARRTRRGGARRGLVPHRRVAPPRAHAPQHDGQLHGRRLARRARRRPGRGRDLDDSPRNPNGSVTRPRHTGRMRVLITGSSGQIGTNLGLQLLDDGHEVFGVDKRQNAWTDAFPTWLQDLSGHYPAYHGGIGGIEYPEVDVVVHLAAHAKVHQLVREPHRALENAIMTFNVLEYARQLGLPLVFSSTREVYGDVHRFEEYAEEAADFAFTESPYSASKIASEAFIYSYARCYGLNYLVFRFSNVYGRYDSDLWRMDRVLPLWMHQLSRGEPITIFGGDQKVLDLTYVDDCVHGIARGVYALA